MIWFSEAYRWADGFSWLGIVNPRETPQTITVSILSRPLIKTLEVGGRSRIAVELGEWGLSGDFGVEVRCASVCAASLVMWNKQYTVAHESIPILGCKAP